MRFANPFAAEGNWYRGNLHLHTSNSDGRLSPEAAVRLYQEHGYDFVAITDHNKLTLLEPSTEPAFQKEPGPIVEIYPAIVMDQVPEKPEDIVRQRYDLFFEHLTPQCLACRLAHNIVRVFLGHLFEDRSRRGILFHFQYFQRRFSDTPVRVRQTRDHGMLHVRPAVGRQG